MWWSNLEADRSTVGDNALPIFHPFRKELRIGIALLRRSLEPFVGGVIILFHTFTHQIQLAQGVWAGAVSCSAACFSQCAVFSVSGMSRAAVPV